MASEASNGLVSAESEVEQLYLAFVLEREADPDLTIEAFGRRHPAHADDLRGFHDDSERGQSVLRRGGLPEPTGAVVDRVRAFVGRLAVRRPDPERYEVREEIGRGGMGVVYRVWDRNLERHVAMKVLPRDLDSRSSSTLARLLVEAVYTGRLNHPGIVPIHDLGVDDQDRVFFLMKLVEGRTLTEVLGDLRAGRGGWTVERVLGVLRRACEALRYAHGRGLLHRDLKPDNLMVGDFGEVYVMDWGLARSVDGRTVAALDGQGADDDAAGGTPAALTQHGVVLGTPAYMAPEQARGERDSVDPRSDVYSIGAILYHVLADRMPYTEPGTLLSQRAHLKRVLEGEPAPLDQAAPEVRGELAAICSKAMAREPEERYSSMAELEHDLAAFLEGKPVRAYEDGALTQLRKWVRRNPGPAALLGLVVALGAALVGGFLYMKSDEADRLRRAIYESALRTADADQRDGTGLATRAALEGVAPELRDWEWHHFWARVEPGLGAFELHAGAATALASSRDGSWAASAGLDGRLLAWSIATGELRAAPMKHRGRLLAVDLSPDQELIAAGGEDELALWSAATGQRVAGFGWSSDEGGGTVNDLAFLSDARLVTAGKPGGVQVWDVPSGRRVEDPMEPPGTVLALALDPKGRYVAGVNHRGEVTLWRVRGWDAVASFRATDELLACPALSFDATGELLFTGGDDRVVRAWTVDDLIGALDPEPLAESAGFEHGLLTLALHPGGALVAASADGEVRFLKPDTLADLGELFSAPGGAADLLLPGDGRVLYAALGDGRVGQWDTATPTGQTRLAGHLRGVGSAAFSPDGTRLASGGDDHTLRLWSVELGAGEAALRGHGDRIWDVAWSPDGRLVASGSPDTKVGLWDADGGALIDLLGGHEGEVHAVAFREHPRALVSASSDGTLRTWIAAEGSRSRVVWRGEPLRSMALYGGGRRAACGTQAGSVLLIDLKTGETLARFDDHEGGAVRAVALSPDEGTLASASVNGGIVVRDLVRERVPTRLASPAAALAFSPDGRRLVSGGWSDPVQIWDAATLRPVVSLPHTTSLDVAFRPDGSSIAVAGRDRRVTLWHAQVPRELGLARLERERMDTRLAPEVEELLGTHVLAARAAEAALTHPGWTPAERLAGARQVRATGDVPGRLGLAAWGVAREADASPARRAEALAWAEFAQHATSPTTEFTLTEAALHVRLAQWDEAEADLDRIPERVGWHPDFRAGSRVALALRAVLEAGRANRFAALDALSELEATRDEAAGDPDALVVELIAEAEQRLRALDEEPDGTR
ncbi:MAG: serine/threonine-protein kinase [Planctomycetota bacterium]